MKKNSKKVLILNSILVLLAVIIVGLFVNEYISSNIFKLNHLLNALVPFVLFGISSVGILLNKNKFFALQAITLIFFIYLFSNFDNMYALITILISIAIFYLSKDIKFSKKLTLGKIVDDNGKLGNISLALILIVGYIYVSYVSNFFLVTLLVSTLISFRLLKRTNKGLNIAYLVLIIVLSTLLGLDGYYGVEPILLVCVLLLVTLESVLYVRGFKYY